MRLSATTGIVLTVLVLSIIPIVQADPTEYEIAYDEGDVTNPQWSLEVGSYFAVLFTVPTPPGPTAVLVRAKFYLRNDNPSAPWPFEVIVFAADGITVLRAIQVLAPSEKGWYDVAIPPVAVIDDFYIAMKWITEPSDQVWLYVDPSPKDNRSYRGPPMSKDSKGWWTDLMIRAVVTEYTFVGGVLVPFDKFGLLAPYVGLASTILVTTVATAIYVKRVKRRKEKQ